MPQSSLPLRSCGAMLVALFALLALFACCKQMEAGEPVWIDQRQIGPFVCRAVQPIASSQLERVGLPQLEAELRRVLALRPCSESIEILLLPSEEAHRDLVALRHPTAPYRRALFVKQGNRATVFAYQHEDLATDLRHECTHALLHADLPMVPLWLDEGLAEYFEPEASDRPRGPSHLRALQGDLRWGRLRTIAELEQKHELSELDQRDYRFAWAWTHFMLHGPEKATQQLWAYLSALRRNEPPGMLSERLAKIEPELNNRFAAHFRDWPHLLRKSETLKQARNRAEKPSLARNRR